MQTPKNKNVDADTSSHSIEEDMNVLLKGLEDLDFDHPRIQKKLLQQAFKIWSDAQPTQTMETKRKRVDFLTSGPKGEATIKQDRREISNAFREAMETTISSSKKLKIVQFDTPKPSCTSSQEPEVIDNSPNVSLTPIEEEEPATRPSPSKSPSISLSPSPPKPPLVSPTQTPPPSLTKEPTPPIETNPEKSSTKSLTKSPTKSPTKTKITTVDPNPSSEKPRSEGKSPSTLAPSNKAKRKFKLNEIVKPDFVPMEQLAELSKAVN